MARSLAGGDYRLVMTIESASSSDRYYRICTDLRDGTLSCDCHSWTFAGGAPSQRSCKHTEIARRLSDPVSPIAALTSDNTREVAEQHPLIRAAREQWMGLTGTWSLEERNTTIDGKAYHFVLLRLVTMNGVSAHGVIAFAQAHRATQQRMNAGVAGWCGFMIAAEVARVAGYRLVGQPPEHFRVTRRTADAGTTSARRRQQDRIGLADILRVGDHTNLGDGLTPKQRAENTLRLFLGPMFNDLERQGFLDVSSQRYPGRVYRLRRDPDKLRDRRVRVFERGNYAEDLCIVRAQDCPADDSFLTTFLRLLSDEEGLLRMLHRGNHFKPYSDGREPEMTPAVWVSRAA